MKNLGKMMKTAQEMQAKIAAAQQEFETIEVEGQAGGGMVTVTMNLKGALRRVKIDPSLVKPEETEIIEDLLVAAVNDGRAKAEAEVSRRMSEIAGGLNLPPGMDLPF
ncbi:MAG: YbaB/EbfC family nucleoid-associated protein [Alphaproteobacteria bacterium]